MRAQRQPRTHRPLRARRRHGAWVLEEGPRVRLRILPMPDPERPWLPFQQPPDERWDSLAGGLVLAIAMLAGLLLLMGTARLLIALAEWAVGR